MGNRLRIYLRDIWFKYDAKGEWALRGITIDFNSNEATMIRGHNGSGKTTLMKIASLIYRPTKGSVTIDDKDFWDLDDSDKIFFRRRVAFIHDKPIMLRGSVRYNIEYGLLVRGIRKEEVSKRYEEVIEELGLRAIENKSSHRLSAGQAQLVAIARALVVNPEIIFLDEPFAYLDNERRRILVRALRERRENGVGIIIVSHDLEISLQIGIDRIITMENGEISDISLLR
ncbi:MAG TPA: ABC transporter ATP-binding protein [Sulfolobales archaeon]|nr:ABC transporter ATP-binding protein [Sulfolobales archaeon]